jgi:TolB-like protein/Tfp pilus assembly protein PilF
MALDERATMAALDAARAILRADIEAHGGRVIDMAGDSVLALFDTAAGALAASLDAQQKLERASRDVPEDRRLRVRIGLHLGDVAQKSADDTVYGDGINLSARLQTVARPGGVCISQTFYETVRGKLDFQAQFGGRQSFKHIREPLAVWHAEPGVQAAAPRRRWLAPAAAAGVAALALAGGAWWYAQPARTHVPAAAADARSIAVLPFVNMSDEKDASYFAEGVQEDLLTQLALLGELKVISRTSAAEYRSSPKNVRQIGGELGAAVLVQGSVRRAGSRVRVNVQLIDSRSDKHLWAGTYDREVKDIFAIQSELATEIARAFKVSLTPGDTQRMARRPTENLEAYELFLQQQELAIRSLSNVSSATQALAERIALLSRAVELDPRFALAWARLGAEHARAHFYSLDPSPQRLAHARQAIERALAVAPNDLEVRIEAGNVHYYGDRDYARAAQYFGDLVRSAPNHITALTQLALVRRRQGQWLDSTQLLQRVASIDARYMPALTSLVENLLSFRRFDEAIALQRRLVAMQPGNLDAACTLHEMEWLKTGSFASYDAWRATLPASAERMSARIWGMDLARVAVKRDFDAMLRQLDLNPSLDQWSLGQEIRAVALAAKGARAPAQDLARRSLREAQLELKREPGNHAVAYRVLLNRALLGERGVLADYQRWTKDLAPDALRALDAVELEPYLHALLGDRQQAMARLQAYWQRPAIAVPSVGMKALLFVLLGDTPGFRELADDPASNAPRSLQNE